MKQIAKLFFVACLVILNTMPSIAHGVRIDQAIDATSGEITVTAAFDTGEVLNEAAVVIFAPNDLINPWGTGVMDEDGSYTFRPDYTIEGFWDIQVRKAGHGGLINVEITEDMMPDPADSTADTDDDTHARTITLSDGSQITITGNVNFNVSGDTIIFETEQSSSNTADASSSQSVADRQGASGFTNAQILIMSLSVIWGCVGTALYFMRRKTKLET